MPEYIEFPLCIFKPNDILFKPIFRNTSGTTSIAGATQVIGSASGAWEATISGANIRNSKLVQLWEVLELRSQGRLQPMIVPMCGRKKLKLKKTLQNNQKGIPHSDDAYFSDNIGYNQFNIPVIAVETMDLGARSGKINIQVETETLEAGLFFSVNNRLYRIDYVDEIGNNQYAIKFWPRLREAIPIGEFLNFETPSCLMRLKTDDAMSVVKRLHKFASPDIEFVEYF